MVSVPTKKTVVRTLVESGFAKVSEVCRAIGLSRTSFYAPSRRSHESVEIEHRAVKLSQEKPRYGYRRVTEMLNRIGQGTHLRKNDRNDLITYLSTMADLMEEELAA